MRDFIAWLLSLFLTSQRKRQWERRTPAALATMVNNHVGVSA
ncbi:MULTISPECIES: hypothetical protein [Streptomyces]|nr:MULTISPECIES: hypothetical protein [Streptomyces]